MTDDPAVGRWWERLPPCGHTPVQRGCGGCDPGADEFVLEDGASVPRPVLPHDYEFPVGYFAQRLRITREMPTYEEEPVATYTWRIVTTKRHEWLVPWREPWGADIVEFNKAQHVADQQYRQHHGLGKKDPVPDNYLSVKADEENVIIFFEVEVT